MAIKKVGVLGCGLMGSGIAQVAAQSGYEVIVREVNQELLDKGLGRISDFLSKGVKREKLSQSDMDETLSKITGTIELSDLSDCDIVIEVIIEKMELKAAVYKELSEACKSETIFASNTSSLSITEMASHTNRPDKMVGLHFFNPVPLMKLVEVARSVSTSSESFDTVYEFAKSLGKTPVKCNDTTGFIVNRLLVPYLLDSIRQLENGLATVEDIDNAMKLGLGYPMGPLTLLDFVGIDTTLYIADIMFEEFKEHKYAAPPLMRRMVHAGYFGRKSGKGFYDYTSDPVRVNELGT
ncbi:3-hydroxybutyryl-CoA dehydrogenase [Candidatus Marinimicrobia bacterium MT.SAG.4]|nr:3-hydroxybutyryl-CoA dehydrogenase [Candidatus Marinimicrobia bacterium MT.SAG.4]